MTKQNAHERYHAAFHAMQSGVAFTMESDPKQIEPKHLRVGINAALVGQAALVLLLIAKGVFTDDEYMDMLAREMETEAERYRLILQALYPNTKIDLA